MDFSSVASVVVIVRRLVVLFGEYGWNTGSHVPNVDQVSAFEEQGIVARAANWEPEVRLLLEKHRESLRE